MNPNIAVVGCGRWGRNLVRNFAQLGALRTVCDLETSMFPYLAETYPQVQCQRDLTAVLADDEVSGVVVATPASTHFRVAKAALDAGKDVLVEKPLALCLRDGEELVRGAQEKGLILMVGHLLCYHPAVVKLRELVRAGTVGNILYVYSHRLNLGHVRQEENVLWSFAPHDISTFLLLLQGTPISVSAHGSVHLQEGIVDVTMATLEFDQGVQAHIFVNWLHPQKEHKLALIGDRGMAVFDDLQPDAKLTFHAYSTRWVGGVPSPSSVGCSNIEVVADEPLRRECQHFLECIEKRQVPQTDGHNGLAVLRVLEACQLSLENKGAAVFLSTSTDPVLSG